MEKATAAAARGGDREQALLSETPPAPAPARTATLPSSSPSSSCVRSCASSSRFSSSSSFTVRQGDANDILLPPGPAVSNPNPDPDPDLDIAAVAVGGPKLLPAKSAGMDQGDAAAEDGTCDGDSGGAGACAAAGAGASAPSGAGGWDFIDVDPFGSCLPFLEAAVAAVKDGGLLAVAATDLAVLCGKRGGRQVKAAVSSRSSRPLRNRTGVVCSIHARDGMSSRAAAFPRTSSAYNGGTGSIPGLGGRGVVREFAGPLPLPTGVPKIERARCQEYLQ